MTSTSPFASAFNNQAWAKPLTSESLQEALQPLAENLKTWVALGQKNATALAGAAQAALKDMTNPDFAEVLSSLKSRAEQTGAMAKQQAREATAVGIAQFTQALDTLDKKHPAPEAFAPVSRGLKTAAAAAEKAVLEALKK